MTGPVTRERMAHALSVLGEAGLGGYQYDSAIGMLTRKTYDSTKGRWMLASSPTFSSTEFQQYMSLAVANGFVDAGPNSEKVKRGELDGEDWLLRLTLEGWNYIEDYDRPVIESWFNNIRDNIPTIVVSSVLAVATAWLLLLLGP